MIFCYGIMNSSIYGTIGAVSLAAVLVISMITTPAFAARTVITDDSDDATNPDFDITQVATNNRGPIIMTVAGTAGGTTPSGEGEANLVYAYVFITDAGIYAVTSHQAEDSGQVENDIEWHTHLVTLNSDNCVTSIEDAGKAIVAGPNVLLSRTGATEVIQTLTAELTISGSGVCVTDVFDAAPNF